jgi:hypothetical protein
MKVILKIVYFISIALAVVVISFFAFNYTNNKALKNFKVKPNVTSLFVGDSHIKLAVNDSIVQNSANIALTSESYYFSYLKLNEILNTNPSIKKVYIGFGYQNLSSYFDDYIFGMYSKDVSSRYFFIMPFSEKVQFAKYNKPNALLYFRYVFTNGLKNSVTKNKTFIGCYENIFKNISARTASMDNRIAHQYYNHGVLYKPSEFNTLYLTKVVELCRKKNVRLIMLNTPVHPYYRTKIPAEYIALYNKIVQEQHLEVLDLSNLLTEDSCFVPDGDHVSEKGALLVSKHINQLQLNALLK